MKFSFVLNAPSQGVNNLSLELRTRGHSVKKSNKVVENIYKTGVRKGFILVNWGNSSGIMSESGSRMIRLEHRNVILNSVGTKYTTNKLHFFHYFSQWSEDAAEKYFVPWTSSRAHAIEWISEGKTIVCRKLLTGHSGTGIVIVDNTTHPNDIPSCNLYTQYIPKKHEYRVHIFRWTDREIWQQKRSIKGYENVNFQVRNHKNGWVFTRQNMVIPETVKELLADFKKEFFEKNSQDFGAVDIIYNEQKNRAYILEVNSAPGMEGSTAKDYAEILEEAYKYYIIDGKPGGIYSLPLSQSLPLVTD